MAKFNPDVPDIQAPSYLGLSQGAGQSVMEGNKSTGIALSGLGDIIKGATTGADTVIKSVIDEALYNRIDQQREGMTGALEQIAGVPQANRVADIQPSGEQAGGLMATTSQAPPQVDASLSSVGSLTNGYNSGKLSPTYYTGRLDMISKDMRNQFPGYRDYIDTKVAEITGGNPANEYMKQLLTNINQGIAQNRTDTEHALNFLKEKDIQNMPGIQGVIDAVASGKAGANPMAYVLQKTYQWRATLADFNRRAAERANWEGDQKELAIKADRDLTQFASDTVNMSTINLGGSFGKLGFDQFKNLIEDINTGKVTVSAEEGQRLYQAAQTYYSNIYNTIYNKANERGVKNAPSMAAILTPEKTKQNIESSLAGVAKQVELIGNKDYGTASMVQRANEAIANDSQNKFLTSTNTNVQTYTRAISGMQKIVGPQAIGGVIKDFVSDGLLPSLRTVVEKQKGEIVSQQGDVLTLQRAIENLRKSGVGVPDPTNPNAPGKLSENGAYDSLINLTSKVGDKSLTEVVKKNIINGSYGKGNEDLLYNFDKDTFDDKGNLIPGRYSVYQKMTSPEITNAVYELGKKDPQVWQNYKNWVETNHGKIFGDQIRDINQLAINPNLKFTYNNETHQIGLSVSDRAYTQHPLINANNTRAIDAQMKNYENQIAFINSGLQTMSGIAKKEGTDVNAYVLRSLLSQNLSPDSVGLQVAKAVAASNPPQLSENPSGPSLEAPNWSNQPGAAFNEMITRGGQRFKDAIYPALKDLSGLIAPDQTGRGSANAAHISPEWGNPLAPTFHRDHMTEIATPSGGKVSVNKYAAQAFEGFLNDLAATGYKMNDVQGYEFRQKRNGGGISQHAFGNAIDINPKENQYQPLLGKPMKSNLPDNVSELAAKWGLTWGGDWHSLKDPMHFEYTGKMPARGNNLKIAGTP